jgi:cyanophycin synthetase
MQFKKSLSTRPFWQALRDKGYEIESTSILDKPILRLTSPSGKQWLTSTNISHPTTSTLVTEIATNKWMAYKVIETMGISMPYTLCVSREDTIDEKAIFSRAAKLITKPRDSLASRGVTLNITTKDELHSGLEEAWRYSAHAIIQQMVTGDEMRFTILDGEVVSVLQRQTPRVVGNGKSTIAELIEQENIVRRSRRHEYIAYPELDATLIDAGYLTDSRVLEEGYVLELSKSTLVKTGATIYERIDDIHASYLSIVNRIANELGSSFIVVDLFVQDYTKPATADAYWFNELNVSSALVLYYAPINKDDTHIANMIVDKFDKMITKGL